MYSSFPFSYSLAGYALCAGVLGVIRRLNCLRPGGSNRPSFPVFLWISIHSMLVFFRRIPPSMKSSIGGTRPPPMRIRDVAPATFPVFRPAERHPLSAFDRVPKDPHYPNPIVNFPAFGDCVFGLPAVVSVHPFFLLFSPLCFVYPFAFLNLRAVAASSPQDSSFPLNYLPVNPCWTFTPRLLACPPNFLVLRNDFAITGLVSRDPLLVHSPPNFFLSSFTPQIDPRRRVSASTIPPRPRCDQLSFALRFFLSERCLTFPFHEPSDKSHLSPALL